MAVSVRMRAGRRKRFTSDFSARPMRGRADEGSYDLRVGIDARRALFVCALVLACCAKPYDIDNSIPPAVDAGDDAGIADAAIDAASDAATDARADADSPSCFGPAGWTVCLAVLPTRTFTPPAVIDTDSSPECLKAIPKTWSTAGQPDACFVTARTIDVTTSVSVTGTLPLVLVATDSISIGARIDAASHRGGASGPNASPAVCPSYTTAPQPSNVAGFAGGGAGGSFATAGGAGGAGNGTTTNRGLPTGAVSTRPATLRGGCRGQNGGNGLAAGGQGGAGGGALYLVAGVSITLSPAGVVNVSGAGGTGGAKYTGGGGGGAGGFVAIHAPSIVTAAGSSILANGGGGSSGVDGGDIPGAGGEDPAPATPFVAARGGTIGGNGNGGDGYAAALPATPGFGASGVGGGGGGGGAGFVVSSGSLGAAKVSPVAGVF